MGLGWRLVVDGWSCSETSGQDEQHPLLNFQSAGLYHISNKQIKEHIYLPSRLAWHVPRCHNGVQANEDMSARLVKHRSPYVDRSMLVSSGRGWGWGPMCKLRRPKGQWKTIVCAVEHLLLKREARYFGAINRHDRLFDRRSQAADLVSMLPSWELVSIATWHMRSDQDCGVLL